MFYYSLDGNHETRITSRSMSVTKLLLRWRQTFEIIHHRSTHDTRRENEEAAQVCRVTQGGLNNNVNHRRPQEVYRMGWSHPQANTTSIPFHFLFLIPPTNVKILSSLQKITKILRLVRIMCSHTKEFHNSLKWSITVVYLFGDKLTVRVAICNPLCTMGTGTKSSRKEGHAHSLSALTVQATTTQVGHYLKHYWLNEFPHLRFV